MKVTVPEHQSKTTLSALLLELQLTNELAQLSSAISVYQELIAFCLQYAFLLKNEDSAPIGEVFSQKQERLSTPDPARDGVNWLVYCAANPVGRWDPSGCWSQEYDKYVLHGNTDNQYNGTVEGTPNYNGGQTSGSSNSSADTKVVTNSETPSLSVMQFAAAVMRIIPYYPAYTTAKKLTYISEKREEALDWADENWPSWLTLTGSVRMDQDAIAAAMAILRPEIGLAQQSLQYMMPLLEASGFGSQLLLGGNTTSTLEKTVTDLVPYYPGNGGAGSEIQRIFLMPGDQIDRYGRLNGKYFSPLGTPLEMRSLPYNADTTIYNSFTVIKPFEVDMSRIAPAFGQFGGGIEFLSPLNAEVLLKRGIIE